MSISPRLRFEVLRRDGYRCRYCGVNADTAVIVVDHVVPAALGGKTEASNLVAACQPCNAGKSSITPDASMVDAVADDAIRWAAAIRQAAALLAAEREAAARATESFDAEWKEWRHRPYSGTRWKEHPRDDTWDVTVERFIHLGLDIDTLLYLLRTAMAAKKVQPENVWAYFCGCCWNTIADLQTEATKLLRVDDQ